MELIKLKLRGLGRIPETTWCDLSSGINLFQIPDRTTRRAFIEAIQTINPPHDCLDRKLFSDLPTRVVQNGYTRIIQPHKRSIAIGVFSTTSELVRILSPISAHFYELDRVEVGRRLDYSRWMNYVELASSTRWSEVEETAWSLFRAWGSDRPDLEGLLLGLLPTDRIKGSVMEELDSWLEKLLPKLPEDEKARGQDLLEAIHRANHFSTAKHVTEGYLPLFLEIDLGTRHQLSAQLNGADPLSYLLTRLYLEDAEAAQTRPDRIPAGFCNDLLATHAPELPLHFEQQGSQVVLNCDNELWSPLAADAGTEELLVYAGLLTALHRALFTTSPVLLMDGNSDVVSQAAQPLGEICQWLCFTDGRKPVPNTSGIRHHDFEAIAVHRDTPK